jgi:5'-3' exonuclease
MWDLKNAVKMPCYVYSVDHDYIVYSQYVTGMIGPKLRDRFVLKRSDILQKLQITSNQFIWCFCAAGSDDVNGISKIGFKKALNACKGVKTAQKTSTNLKNVSIQVKTDLTTRINSYLGIISRQPEVLLSIPTRTTVRGQEFIVETKIDGFRRRLHRLGLDASSPYGIGLVPWVSGGKIPIQKAKYPRPFQKIDKSKAKHARNFEYQLEPVELDPEVEESIEQPQQQKGKRKSTKRKAEHDTDALTIKKRKRNMEKQVLDNLSSLHMKYVRTLGSVTSLVSECMADDFVPWFQKELANIKVFNF